MPDSTFYGVFAKRPSPGTPGAFNYSAASGIWPEREAVDNHRAWCEDRAAMERPDDPVVYVVCEVREVSGA